MSYQHIRLEQIEYKDSLVTYQILCPDFNDKSEWENLGQIEIDLNNKTYVHKNNEKWLDYKIIPIEICDLNIADRKNIIDTKYPEFASGSWSLKIHEFIKNIFKNNEYPKLKEFIA